MKKYDLFWEGTVRDHIVSGGLLSCTHHLLNQKRQIKDAHLTFWVQDGTLQRSLVSVSVQLPKVSLSSYPNDLSAQIKSPCAQFAEWSHVGQEDHAESVTSSARWEKRKRGCSPDITSLTQCITHLENLLLCGKVLSGNYHLIIIVSLGVWNGMGGRRRILKSLLIL